MKDILFNSHDVALMLVIGLYGLIATRIAISTGSDRTARLMVAGFFVLNAITLLDILLFWGDSIRHAAFAASSALPLSLSFASFAVGPVLYGYFRGQLNEKAVFRARDALHLLPALATPVYLYWACYQHPPELQREFVLELSILGDRGSQFLTFLTLKKLIPACYGVVCLMLVLRAQQARRNGPFLTSLSVGFTSIWLWALLTHTLGQWLPVSISDPMGIFGNYMGLALGVYIFFRLTDSPAFTRAMEAGGTDRIDDRRQPSSRRKVEEISVTLAGQIDRIIHTEKPYLSSQLTLERFAELVQAPPRQVSAVINSCYHQTFHEFINGFRIEEARRLLHDPECQHLAIFEVAKRAGFNSKPTFNRLFKCCVGATPSAFRRQYPPTLYLNES